MSASRLHQLRTIDAQTLKQGLDQQAVTLIDVREPGEFAGSIFREQPWFPCRGLISAKSLKAEIPN